MNCALTERDMERMLRDCRFANESHKERLMRRLQELDSDAELSVDDLEMAAGGAAPPEVEPPSTRCG